MVGQNEGQGGFGNDLTNVMTADSQEELARRSARTVKLMGKGVVKVVHRCDDAKENKNLDLSSCQLVQVPDAIFHLMRETPLTTCNLASNIITKIPPKLAMSFTLITDLNVSNNRISKLPTELSACTSLERLNISGNSFIQLPPVLLDIPSLLTVDAGKNFIAEVEVDALKTSLPALQSLHLENNPLKKEAYEALLEVTSCKVVLSPREKEDWEDLSI